MNNIQTNINKMAIIKWALIAAAAYILYRQLTKKKGGGLLNREPQTSELTELLEQDESGKIQGTATITPTKAANMANRIKGAWGLWNDDEEAIYQVFQEMRSLADLLLVTEKYGYYQPNILEASEDLAASLRKRLSKKELSKVNEILKERGVNYAF